MIDKRKRMIERPYSKQVVEHQPEVEREQRTERKPSGNYNHEISEALRHANAAFLMVGQPDSPSERSLANQARSSIHEAIAALTEAQGLPKFMELSKHHPLTPNGWYVPDRSKALKRPGDTKLLK
jgi:hypothetical protein